MFPTGIVLTHPQFPIQMGTSPRLCGSICCPRHICPMAREGHAPGLARVVAGSQPQRSLLNSNPNPQNQKDVKPCETQSKPEACRTIASVANQQINMHALSLHSAGDTRRTNTNVGWGTRASRIRRRQWVQSVQLAKQTPLFANVLTGGMVLLPSALLASFLIGIRKLRNPILHGADRQKENNHTRNNFWGRAPIPACVETLCAPIFRASVRPTKPTLLPICRFRGKANGRINHFFKRPFGSTKDQSG